MKGQVLCHILLLYYYYSTATTTFDKLPSYQYLAALGYKGSFVRERTNGMDNYIDWTEDTAPHLVPRFGLPR